MLMAAESGDCMLVGLGRCLNSQRASETKLAPATSAEGESPWLPEPELFRPCL